MNSPRGVITICLSLCNFGIFCESVPIIGNNGVNVVAKFIAEYKIHLDEIGDRHVTVIGTSEDHFRSAEPLIEEFPHFLGTNVTKICETERFCQYTVIVHFLESLEEEYLDRVIEDLKPCKMSKTYLIFEGNSGLNSSDVVTLLQRTLDKTKYPPIFVHRFESEDSLKAFGLKKVDGCSMKVGSITDWMPGDGVEKLHIRFKEFGTRPGCPLKIATVHDPPWMELERDATVGTRMKGGYEGVIISEFTEKFNYTPVVRDFEMSDGKEFETIEAIVSSCAAGTANIGIGRIRPTDDVASRVAVSQMYTCECVVWCVPRIIRWKGSPVFSEFSWQTWIFMGLILLVGFAIEMIVRDTPQLSGGNIRKPDCISIILDIVGVNLGNPIVYRPSSVGSKALLIIYISYSIVMTTAYKTSLSSMFALENMESTIVDVEGIIRANLTPGGDEIGLAFLEDQRNESEWMPELIKRYVIENNVSKALRRVSNDRDFAYLVASSPLVAYRTFFEKSGEKVSLDVLDGCVMNSRTVVVFPKASPQVSEFDRFFQTIVERGILTVWRDRNFTMNRVSPVVGRKHTGMVNTRKELAEYIPQAIFYILYLYCAVMVFCLLVFIGELIVHKFRCRAGKRRLDDLKLFKTNPLLLKTVDRSIHSTQE